MKKIFIFLIFLQVFMLQARNIRKKNPIKKYHLTDGSLIKGKFLSETKDSVKVETKFIGKVALNKRNIGYSGENMNKGTLFGIYPFLNGEKNNVFKSSPIFLFSNSRIFDEKIASTLDLTYMYKGFNTHSAKFLKTKSDVDSSFAGIVEGDYHYNANILATIFVLRFNPLPNDLQEEILEKYHLYPYVGVGGGYLFGFIKYELNSGNTDIPLRDFDYKNYIYTGPNYEFLIGAALRISARTALILEITHKYSKITQKLFENDKESGMKKDIFQFEGITPMIGIRFGRF